MPGLKDNISTRRTTQVNDPVGDVAALRSASYNGMALVGWLHHEPKFDLHSTPFSAIRTPSRTAVVTVYLSDEDMRLGPSWYDAGQADAAREAVRSRSALPESPLDLE